MSACFKPDSLTDDFSSSQDSFLSPSLQLTMRLPRLAVKIIIKCVTEYKKNKRTGRVIEERRKHNNKPTIGLFVLYFRQDRRGLRAEGGNEQSNEMLCEASLLHLIARASCHLRLRLCSGVFFLVSRSVQ